VVLSFPSNRFPWYMGVNTLERELLWNVIGMAHAPGGVPLPLFFRNCRF